MTKKEKCIIEEALAKQFVAIAKTTILKSYQAH